jgi:NAD/NADP transhydrogenase alpha subunit
MSKAKAATLTVVVLGLAALAFFAWAYSMGMLTEQANF